MKGPGPSRGNWLRRVRVLLDRRTGQLLRTPKGWRVYGRPIGISLVLALAIALVVAQNFLPNRITLRAGDVATQNIVAPRSVRYESLTKTQEARDAAASQVPDQFDAALTTQQRQAIDSLGSKLTDLRKQGSGPAQAAQLIHSQKTATLCLPRPGPRLSAVHLPASGPAPQARAGRGRNPAGLRDD